jgi:hypothetical protein
MREEIGAGHVAIITEARVNPARSRPSGALP